MNCFRGNYSLLIVKNLEIFKISILQFFTYKLNSYRRNYSRGKLFKGAKTVHDFGISGLDHYDENDLFDKTYLLQRLCLDLPILELLAKFPWLKNVSHEYFSN